ncbi:hypothetical protein [Dactylosporangium darangshiense]|uniref:hypothetical protein n=1 Tax=Dactylosporangium darangshiense TaxID=579108 RepID=UPI00362D34A3
MSNASVAAWPRRVRSIASTSEIIARPPAARAGAGERGECDRRCGGQHGDGDQAGAAEHGWAQRRRRRQPRPVVGDVRRAREWPGDRRDEHAAHRGQPGQRRLPAGLRGRRCARGQPLGPQRAHCCSRARCCAPTAAAAATAASASPAPATSSWKPAASATPPPASRSRRPAAVSEPVTLTPAAASRSTIRSTPAAGVPRAIHTCATPSSPASGAARSTASRSTSAPAGPRTGTSAGVAATRTRTPAALSRLSAGSPDSHAWGAGPARTTGTAEPASTTYAWLSKITPSSAATGIRSVNAPRRAPTPMAGPAAAPRHRRWSPRLAPSRMTASGASCRSSRTVSELSAGGGTGRPSGPGSAAPASVSPTTRQPGGGSQP